MRWNICLSQKAFPAAEKLSILSKKMMTNDIMSEPNLKLDGRNNETGTKYAISWTTFYALVTRAVHSKLVLHSCKYLLLFQSHETAIFGKQARSRALSLDRHKKIRGSCALDDDVVYFRVFYVKNYWITHTFSPSFFSLLSSKVLTMT